MTDWDEVAVWRKRVTRERERAEAAEAALRLLYDYTVALENASAPWFATRSYAVLPPGGLEVGKQVRAVLDALETA